MCVLSPLSGALGRTFQVYCNRIALLYIERIERKVRIGYSFFPPPTGRIKQQAEIDDARLFFLSLNTSDVISDKRPLHCSLGTTQFPVSLHFSGFNT